MACFRLCLTVLIELHNILLCLVYLVKCVAAKQSWINYGHALYCSRLCQNQARRKGKMVSCFVCSKEAYRSPRQLKRSKSDKFFCGKSCQTLWRNQLYKGQDHVNWKGGASVDYRQILKGHCQPVCSVCHVKDERVLCVHHIDQNRKNNTLANLVWLCYNCHHLVHNHGLEVKNNMVAMV